MTAPVVAPTGDGVTVAVHDLGGTGPPLVMAHAAGFHGQVLAALARHLAGEFWCVSFDGRGHGDTPLPPGMALDWYGMAADVLAVVDALGLERPYGFGHSSGATLVLMAELARPGTFSAIYCFEPVIVAADPPLGRDTHSWLGNQARRRRRRFGSRDEARRHYGAKPPFDTLDPQVLQAYVDHGFADGGGGVMLKCDPEVEATVYEMASAHDAYGRLPQLRCPVVVACGSETEGCTPQRARSHAARMPSGAHEVLDGLGHLGPLEDPERVAAAVRAALCGDRA